MYEPDLFDNVIRLDDCLDIVIEALEVVRENNSKEVSNVLQYL